MSKTIGLTGGTGVIGQILLKQLNNFGYKVILFQGDIRKKEDVLKWLKSDEFDCIFHLAAIVPVIEVEKDPFKAYETNVGGTINLLSCIQELKINPWLFYASTSHVYKISNAPIKESDKIEPLSIYGETKYYAENICDKFSQSYGCSVCIGRIFSFYHDTQKPPFLYPTIRKRIREDDLSKDFFLHGAKNIRDLSNAEDIVIKIIKLMDKNYSGIINIGSGKGVSIEDFVRKQTSVDLKISTDNNSNISSLVADITLLNKVIEDH